MYPTDDTIVALSSPPGVGARAILRLSGPDAAPIAANVFAFPCDTQPDLSSILRARQWTRTSGRTLLDSDISVPAQLYFFPGPHSYTGEDLAELHVPGSPALTQLLLASLIRAGARPALPGEFTARAFFHGRLDLSQAQAVAEVIAARSDAELRGAQRLLDGELARQTAAIAHAASDILAYVEADIDFADHDIHTGADPSLVADQIHEQAQDIRRLLERSISWSQLRPQGYVVLAGAANAGKSSLANALLGLQRSVVADVAGTTRDLLTAPMTLPHGGECLLVDTAGLGDVRDILAPAAQSRARHAATTADLVLWLFDASDPRPDSALAADLPPDSLPASRLLLVANKIDRCQDPDARLAHLRRLAPANEILPTSATRHLGLDPLKHRIESVLTDHPAHHADGIALTLQQRHALEAAADHWTAAAQLAQESAGLELIAAQLRAGLDELATISGPLATEDLLATIFARFCIGK